MSRGPGRVERHILDALNDVVTSLAAQEPERGTCFTYRGLAQEIYGAVEPTRAQREAVARACRRIVARDDAFFTEYDGHGTVVINPFLDDWHRKTHGAASRT